MKFALVFVLIANFVFGLGDVLPLGCHRNVPVSGSKHTFRTFQQGLKECKKLMTSHMAVTLSDMTNHYDFFCGDKNIDKDLVFRKGNCQKCRGDELFDCGDINATSVYNLNEELKLQLMLVVADTGVFMYKDGDCQSSLLISDAKASSAFYNFQSEEMLVAHSQEMMRYSFDSTERKTNGISFKLNTCQGDWNFMNPPALDWKREELIYSCRNYKTLFVTSLGQKKTTRYDHENFLRDLRYDSNSRQVFFNDMNKKLFLRDLKNSNVTSLSDTAGLAEVQHFCTDDRENKLYVVGRKSSMAANTAGLFTMNYDGTNLQELFSGAELVGIRKLDVFGGVAAWINKNGKSVHKCDLKNCSKSNLKTLINTDKMFKDIWIFHPARQQPNLPTPNLSSSEESTCPPRTESQSTCKLNNKIINCNQEAKPGTVVEGVCPNPNQLLGVPKTFSSICQPSGKWLRIQDCTPECGVRVDVNEERVRIENGLDANIGDYPWHTGLYRLKTERYFNGKTKQEWRYVCGGTLISPKLILTAAHCVSEYGTAFEPEHLRVGLGKILRSMTANESGIIAEVEEVMVPSLYTGHRNNYDFDVALVKLKQEVKYNSHIRPACVDWDNSCIFESSNEVHIAGWGNNKTGKPSEKLQYGKIKYLNFESCFKEIVKHYADEAPIASTQICSNYTIGGSQVSSGDAGGAMTVELNKQHFVLGVISVKLFLNNFGVYVRINHPKVLEWLKDQSS